MSTLLKIVIDPNPRLRLGYAPPTASLDHSKQAIEDVEVRVAALEQAAERQMPVDG